MRETLYIRLHNLDADAPVAYCIAKQDAVAAFAVEHAPLAELAKLAVQRRVVALLPSADVRLATVQVPARQPAKVLQAAPFVLEEQLADDVDDLHFALGARLPDQRWPVAIITHERMAAWLQLLQNQGLRPQQLIPDVLALAVPGPGQFSALLDDGQVVVRTAADTGFVCMLEDLALCLSIADPERQRSLRIIVPRDQTPDLSTLGWPVEILHGFSSPFQALLQQLRPAHAINLLQGRYSQREHVLRWLTPWKPVAIAAAAVLALAVLLFVVQSVRSARELRALDASNIARFQQTFPDEARIVDLSAQLDQRMAQLQGGNGGGLLPLVELLGDAISQIPGLSLQSLQFHDGALYASLNASNLELLDRLKAFFAAGHGVAFNVESANSGADGVQLRIRLGGA